MLNDTALYEELLSDENILDVMGTLECMCIRFRWFLFFIFIYLSVDDPDVAKPATHREYLKTVVIFKEVLFKYLLFF